MEIRSFVDEISQQHAYRRTIKNFSSEEWQLFEEITLILKFPFETTLRMQREQYCPSDFYGDWENLKLELKEFDQNTLANELLKTLEEREPHVKSFTVLASVFIDPRYRVLLSESESAMAISHILKLRKHIKNDIRAIEMAETVDDGQKRKIGRLIEHRKNNNPFYKCSTDESEFLRSIVALPLVTDENVSPFVYWAGNKTIFPDVYNIHCVVNAAAPTQTSVERAFSGLSYILSPLRTNMNDALLNKILLLRLNSDLWKDFILKNKEQE